MHIWLIRNCRSASLHMKWMTIFELVVVTITLWSWFTWNTNMGITTDIKKNIQSDSNGNFRVLPPEVVFVFIVCDGVLKGNSSEGKRMIIQAEILMKSAVALTRTKLRYIVMADSMDIFYKIESIPKKWPIEYQNKISIQYFPTWYPEGREKMVTMFHRCCTARLFIPQVIQNEDAVIYIDTDIMFMIPPEDVWEEFGKFDSQQLASMSDYIQHKDQGKVPQYKEGLDGGITLLNLTRIKTIEGGWTESVLKIFDKYKLNITMADQDILNILFYERPQLMHDLPCEYDFRYVLCHGTIRCKAAEAEGASLLHGNNKHFTEKKQNYMQVVFRLWQEYKMGNPLGDLYVDIRDHVAKLTIETKGNIQCAESPNIEGVFSKRLKIYHDQQESDNSQPEIEKTQT